MIWNSDDDQGRAAGLFDQLVVQIEQVCPDDEAWPDEAEQVCRAVECYLEQDCGCGAVDARTLVLMATQALQTVGEGRVARRFLLHGTGLVRPSEWEVTGGDTVWVLDLRQISVYDDAPLELVFFTGLGIIIDALAEVWDRTGGDGSLGLRHVFQTAEALLGPMATEAEARRLRGEITERCDARLRRQGAARGWQTSPQIINLDVKG